MSSLFTTVIEYPESDGKPMGETDLHRDAMVRHIEILKQYYRGQDVYVSGDLLLYYEKGNPKKFVVPDAFIAKGLKQYRRRTYRLWDEGIVPQMVIETTSKKTKKRDVTIKAEIYTQIGVREYFMFDPTRDYLEPPLQGKRLLDGDYQSIDSEADGSLFSEELGLRLAFDGGELAFIRPNSGERLLSAEEELIVQSEAKQALEIENERLRQQLRKLQGEQP